MKIKDIFTALSLSLVLASCSASFQTVEEGSLDGQPGDLDQEVAGEQPNGDQLGSGGPNTPNGFEVEDITDSSSVFTLCSQAENLVKTTSTVSYAERKNCSFDQAPNLGALDASVQAREISKQSVSISPGSIVCGVEIQSKNGSLLHYDDHLFLTLNNSVLFGSNAPITQYLDKQGEIYQWNFANMVGKPIVDFNAPAYCLGSAAQCQIPAHDTIGPVSLNLDAKLTADIAFDLIKSKAVNFDINLIATGDNDPEDCFHSALELDISILSLQF